MKQKLIAFGDDYYIENEEGTSLFWMDGKAARVRQRLAFKDTEGIEKAYVRERMVAIRGAFYIYRDEAVAVTITQTPTSSTPDRFTIRMADRTELVTRGNVLNYEYEIRRGQHKVAIVSKQWFTHQDTYGVDIQPDQDDILILVSTALIDVMVRSI
ncbi:LURP-one-related family protein [Chloroflexi bacterium TSY]|nr:LURP-one-related family protein [Chloroflexi bacterium TSY]